MYMNGAGLAFKAHGLAGGAARGSYAAKVTREARMEPDLTIELINATVQIEQPTAAGQRKVGTGFLVEAPTPDGRPRTVLVTAAHVFEQMPSDEVRVGWRFQNDDGSWRYAPRPVNIRLAGRPIYTRHPTLDVAVMAIEAPAPFARARHPAVLACGRGYFPGLGHRPRRRDDDRGLPPGPVLQPGRVPHPAHRPRGLISAHPI